MPRRARRVALASCVRVAVAHWSAHCHRRRRHRARARRHRVPGHRERRPVRGSDGTRPSVARARKAHVPCRQFDPRRAPRSNQPPRTCPGRHRVQVVSALATIGMCMGCAAVRRLDEGVCPECLVPPRGRAWARMSHRVRTDPEFALAVYRRITTDAGRRTFVRAYGLPAEAARSGVDA